MQQKTPLRRWQKGEILLSNASAEEVGTSDFSVGAAPLGLWLSSRFWERLKHLACARCIFFIHEQLIVGAVIPDCCENVCGQKRALQNFHLDLRCSLKHHEFIVLGQGKKISCRGCIFFAHKHPMSQAAPCQMLSHATSSIRLNHRIDAGRLKDAPRNLGLAFSGVRLNNN